MVVSPVGISTVVKPSIGSGPAWYCRSLVPLESNDEEQRAGHVMKGKAARQSVVHL
jgi:hypothetical protein